MRSATSHLVGMVDQRERPHHWRREFVRGFVQPKYPDRLQVILVTTAVLIAADEWGVPREWKLRQICGLLACGGIGRDAHNGRGESFQAAHVRMRKPHHRSLAMIALRRLVAPRLQAAAHQYPQFVRSASAERLAYA